MRSGTPKNATYVAGFLAMVFAGIVPMEMLAELTNIVTLFLSDVSRCD